MASPKGASFLAVLTVVVFIAGLSPATAQTVIFVDASATGAGNGSSWADACTAVQPALNAAQPGDQVWVAAGTYVENITLALDVALYGGFAGTEDPATFDLADRDFVANETILDGQAAGSVVTSPSGATPTTRIDGFTIRNGYGPYGGGIHCDSSSPTIANDTVTGNAASYAGGGIYCSGSTPTIANNTITGNTAAYCGGGIFCYYSSPTIANNTITGNTASNYGGGICCDTSSPTIASNTITGNLATYFGGGIYCSGSSTTIANNTITSNSAFSGGGICCRYSPSPPTIVNTIIALNSSGIELSSGTPILRHNCVYGNTGYDFDGLPDPAGTDGNISVDPRFVHTPDPGTDGVWGTPDDDPGDVHLLPGSPGIDAGDNPFAFGDFDLDGLPRIAWCNVDMGAHEYQGPFGDFFGDCSVDLDDYALFEVCLRFSGPDAIPPFDECLEVFDFDLDFDVDLNDFAVFQLVFTRP